MVNDVKEFRSAIAAVRAKARTIGAKYNQLNKVEAEAEDPNLKRLLLAAMRELELGTTRTHEIAIQKIQDYCEGVVARGIPHWQHIAEIHGWRPPEKIK